MSKVVIIGDCHFGVRSGNPIYFKYFAKFYTDLFKYIDENRIDTVIQLGDLTDKRKSIDFLSLQEMKKQFLQPCQDRNIRLYVISGNHDCYFRSTNEVNSVRLLQTPNMVVFDNKPGTDSVNGIDLDFYPWINENNFKESVEYASKSKSKYTFGHFEFNNFRLHKNQIADSGMDHTIFKNYDLVFSGHYHTISRKDNILYTGTPYELDWNDWNDQKGFWVLDTVTDDLEFIRNTHTLYEKIEYNDNCPLPDLNNVHEKFVKLIVKNKVDQRLFDSYLSNLLSRKPYDVSVIDDEIAKSIQESMKTDIEFQSTPDMINCVIDSMETNLDKQILKRMISETYIEALEISKI